jgi:hypothetical protein
VVGRSGRYTRRPSGAQAAQVSKITYKCALTLGRPISDSGDEKDQEALGELCTRVLRRLRAEGLFSAARSLEGFMVLGPDDSGEDVLEKKRQLERVLNRRD